MRRFALLALLLAGTAQAAPQPPFLRLLAKAAAPGHYFATRYEDTPADAATLCRQPGVKGVVWRRTWSQVEPKPATYDFSGFDQVLAALPSGCRLWLFIEFKSFASSPIKNPCPLYLQDHAAPNADGNGAVTCFMWEPMMVQAYSAMLRAAAAKYDHDLRVEGVILQESALSLNGAYSQDVADGGTYTALAWKDGLLGLIRNCASAFPQSRCTAFLNFIRNGQGYLYDVSRALTAVRGCFAGPDILPGNATLEPVYTVLRQHQGCRANSAQNDSYALVGCDLRCVFQYATANLGVNSYLFWNHRVTRSATGLTWLDALPVVQSNPHGVTWGTP
jgi:hypothetical protein